MHIARDDPMRDDVSLLLDEHLVEMFATSPAESVHALDHSVLATGSIDFFTARHDETLLGCVALKPLSPVEGEIKSMRTAPAARGRGVASALLTHVLSEARRRGLRAVSLETGVEEYFGAARRLYLRHGFVECAPFADYALNPHSVFYTLDLETTALSSSSLDTVIPRALGLGAAPQ